MRHACRHSWAEAGMRNVTTSRHNRTRFITMLPRNACRSQNCGRFATNGWRAHELRAHLAGTQSSLARTGSVRLSAFAEHLEGFLKLWAHRHVEALAARQ